VTLGVRNVSDTPNTSTPGNRAKLAMVRLDRELLIMGSNELGVDYILEISVRRDGNELRVSAQLIRTRDQVHIWAQSYDREISHSIAIQEDLAQKVAEQIEVKLSPLYAHRIATPHLVDSEVSAAYLRGRFFFNQFTGEGYRKAISYFQHAIDIDPGFAEAHSGLADS
jgi:hypothetical protein